MVTDELTWMKSLIGHVTVTLTARRVLDTPLFCAACFRHVTVSTRRFLFIDTRYSVANKLLLFVVHCHTSSYTYRIAFLTQQFIIISICQVVFHIIFSLFNLSFHFISFYTIDLN